MPKVFKGDLTRHILKCYPAGKAPDKRPVPNELSMLIFYLQSRPAKIPKAAKMLETRAVTFSNKDNTGNLTATILIMHEIVCRLNVHFSLFAESALEIVDLAVNKSQGDQGLLVLAEELYTDYNKYHNGVLFAGSASFSKLFLNVIDKFVAISQKASPQARVSAINAIKSLSSSPALATSIGQKGLITAVSGLEVNLSRDPRVYDEVTSYEDREIPDSKRKDPGYIATMELRKLLDTNSLDQIIGIVQRVLLWLGTSNDEWQRQLVVHLAKWAPPQNRFVITKTVASAMSSLTVDNVKQMTVYSHYLNVLLTAEESKIGLGVVDVLRRLLRLQHRLIETPPGSVDNQSIQNLLASLRKNIGNLANTNIYPGQSGDMVAEILAKYQYSSSSYSPSTSASTSPFRSEDSSSAFAPTPVTPKNFSRSLGVVINDFKVLIEILESVPVHEHDRDLDQRKLNIIFWESTQWLLTSQHPQLLVLYNTAFNKFLEVAHVTAHPSSKPGSLVIREFCELVQQRLPLMNYVAVYYSILSLVHFYASDAQYIIPWVLEVLPDLGASSGSELSSSVNVSRCSVSLAALLAIFRTLDIEEYASSLFELIGQRVKYNLWLPGITYPPAVTAEVAISSLLNDQELTFLAPQNTDGVDETVVNVSSESIVSLLRLRYSSKFPNNETEFILNPPFALNAAVESDENRSARVRVINESGGSPGVRSLSSRSQTSLVSESQAPRIGDLRKRQADAQSFHKTNPKPVQKKENRISLPPKRYSNATIKPSELDLLSMIDKVANNPHSKGNLTT